MANNNLIESPIDGPGGPGGPAGPTTGLDPARIFVDETARDAAIPAPVDGDLCAIEDGASGQIWQIYDADLPGWRSTGTGGGVTPDTWRDETGTTSNPGFTEVARHDADLLIQNITIGLGSNDVSSNIAFGALALSSGSLSGGSNVGIGTQALRLNTTGSSNNAVGSLSMAANTAGIGNSGFGTSTLRTNADGNNNNAFGNSALLSNTGGDSNNAFGAFALRQNSTGNNNIGMGTSAVRNLSSGSNNTGIGGVAMLALTSGSNNTAIARDAGVDMTAGSNNTIIGYQGLDGVTTANSNTFLGARVAGLPATLSNNVIIADGDGNQVIRRLDTGEVGLAGVTDPTESVDVSGTARLRNTPSNDAGGNSIKRIFLEDDTGVVTGQYNVEGQVKLNNAGGVKPSLTGFTADQPRYFLYNGGALGFSGSPTTQWPSNILAPVDADFISPTTFALLENPIEGQVHIWRILYSYENKGNTSNLGIVVGLINGDNPASSFVTSQNQSAPSGTTATPTFDFSIAQPSITNPSRVVYEQVTLITIADNLSIGTGYRLFAGTTQSDGNLRIVIESVTRTTLQKVIR